MSYNLRASGIVKQTGLLFGLYFAVIYGMSAVSLLLIGAFQGSGEVALGEVVVFLVILSPVLAFVAVGCTAAHYVIETRYRLVGGGV